MQKNVSMQISTRRFGGWVAVPLKILNTNNDKESFALDVCNSSFHQWRSLSPYYKTTTPYNYYWWWWWYCYGSNWVQGHTVLDMLQMVSGPKSLQSKWTRQTKSWCCFTSPGMIWLNTSLSQGSAGETTRGLSRALMKILPPNWSGGCVISQITLARRDLSLGSPIHFLKSNLWISFKIYQLASRARCVSEKSYR